MAYEQITLFIKIEMFKTWFADEKSIPRHENRFPNTPGPSPTSKSLENGPKNPKKPEKNPKNPKIQKNPKIPMKR